jgi:Flp pilus assembly CpaF family ATPase
VATFYGLIFKHHLFMENEALQKLLAKPGLSDLVLNGHTSAFAAIDGWWAQVDSPFDSEAQMMSFAVDLANSARRRLDFGCPFADIAVGSLRYHLALPLSGDRIHVSIRKHQTTRRKLESRPGAFKEQLPNKRWNRNRENNASQSDAGTRGDSQNRHH